MTTTAPGTSTAYKQAPAQTVNWDMGGGCPGPRGLPMGPTHPRESTPPQGPPRTAGQDCPLSPTGVRRGQWCPLIDPVYGTPLSLSTSSQGGDCRPDPWRLTLALPLAEVSSPVFSPSASSFSLLLYCPLCREATLYPRSFREGVVLHRLEGEAATDTV